MAHVAKWKKTYVDELVETIMEKPVVGLVDIHGIPAKQMQTIRENIRDSMILRGSKNTLLRIAINKAKEQGKKNIDSLLDYAEGQCAIVTTDLNPFKLFKKFEDTLTPSPAKGGEIAPDDVVVKKGETQFKPGPMVSTFQKAGLPAAIEKGKIVIKKNKTIVKQGEEITKQVADVLTKLDILPLTVGLNLKAALDEGTTYTPNVLKVDEDAIFSQFKLAAQQAFNMAVFSGYPTEKTVVPLLQKAFNQALSLSVNTGYPTSDSMNIIIGKARSQLMALASMLSPDALDPDIRKALSSTQAVKPASQKDDTNVKETESSEEDEDEDDEVSEDEAAEGLGALFG